MYPESRDSDKARTTSYVPLHFPVLPAVPDNFPQEMSHHRKSCQESNRLSQPHSHSDLLLPPQLSFLRLHESHLYDEVKIAKKKEPGITLTTNLKFLPTGDGNIAYKAAQLLMDEFDLKEGVQITLNKHIPVAAGLAGGSSNAAAVLFGMNRLFGLRLTQQELMDRGVKLGADVPYCIMRGTVLAEGIGEELSVLPAMPKCTVLIAKPPISVSTKMVYEALDSKEIVEHPDIDGILEGLRKGNLHKVADSMGNVLEDVTIPMHPVIADIKKVMQDCGAIGAMMSGSGPTVFGLFENRASAREAQRMIRDKGLTRQAYVTNIHNVRRK